MNNAEIDESVLIKNTAENFQILCTLLGLDNNPSAHRDDDPYIHVDLPTLQAFYSTGEYKQPLISIDLLMQLWLLPTYTARVVLLVESTPINDFHPWKNMYEQILRDSM